MKYHTGVPIGRGGMSEVLEAWDPERRRRVALKLLSRDDPELAARMLKEAQAQALVDHPNVCKVYDVGRLDGRPFIAMQRVDGVTLDRAAPAMSLEQKVRLMATVAEAVHAAHKVGLIHRDLKPGNILVEETAEGFKPFIVDFGIARRQEISGLTITGQVLGTPGYMSPEQARGEARTLDRRSDVFQLGVVLYELLSGAPPFRGDSRVETLIQILEKDPPPLRRLAPHVPTDLETVVTKCLEKEPQRRYGSARELAQDLERFLDGRPILARPVSPVARGIRRMRRHPWISALTAAALIAVLTLTGLWLSARWNAAERARLARRLGQQVERMDAVLRFAHLSPLHDTRPTRRRLEIELAEMRNRIDELPRSLAGVGHAAVGRGHLALGDMARARIHLETAWETGERSADVARDLGRVMSELYREELERAASLRNPELRRAAEAEAERRYKEPALRFLAFARADPGPAADLLEARLAWIEGRWPDARRLARQALDASPWLYEAALLEGDVARSEALEARSAGDTEAMQTGFDQAEESYTGALAIGTSDPLPAQRLCALHGRRMEVAYFDRGEPVEPVFEAVATACGRALEADPGRALPHVLLASAEALASRSLAARGEDPRPALERAVTAATFAVDLCTRQPPAPDCRTARALAHRRRGDAQGYLAEWQRQHDLDGRPTLAAAIDDLERAVLLAPRDPGVFNSLGLAHWERIEWSRTRGEDPSSATAVAVAVFEQAVDLLPEYTHAHSNLGAIYRLRAEHEIETGADPEPSFEAAIASFRKALEANPSNSHALNNLGSVFLEQGHFQLERGRDPSHAMIEALRLYHRSSEVKPDWAFPHFNSGLAHRALGLHALRLGKDPGPHVKDAIRAFRVGHALRDDLALTHVELARVYLVEARWEQAGSLDAGETLRWAERELEIAAELAPGSAEGLLTRGEAALLRGDLDAARRALLAALGERPEDADGLVLLAEVELAAARAAAERGGDPSRNLEAGLQRAEEASTAHPHKAEAWSAKGRLELLAAGIRISRQDQGSAAAHRAAVQLARRAAASLSQALAINPSLGHELGSELAEARALAESS